VSEFMRSREINLAIRMFLERGDHIDEGILKFMRIHSDGNVGAGAVVRGKGSQ
jgi:hypothetical protein